MKQQPTLPTGQAQSFGVNETFFSTTDRRGVITAGNEVFVRISGHARADLLGQPHNLIRHPDMPRSVFHLLWDAVQSGRSFAGFVKNHAKNGNHYWVFALILPIDRGFLSVRIKPTTPLLPQIEVLYGRMAAAERAAHSAGRTPAAAIAESAALLTAEIRRLGFANYEAFSHHALNAEIKSRDTAVAAQRLVLFPAELPRPDPEFDARFRQYGRIYGDIRALFEVLDRFIRAAEDLRHRHDAVRRMAEDFRLAALNAQVASHALGPAGAATGTVAHFLNAYAGDLAQHVGQLTARVDAAVAAMAEIASNLSAARVLLEVLLSFIAEIVAHDGDAAERERLQCMLADLRDAFVRTITAGLEAFARFRGRLPEIRTIGTRLWQDFIQLQVAQISGLTEVARLRSAENLLTMFQGLRGLIGGAQTELRQLMEIIERIGVVNAAAAPRERAIGEELASLEEQRSAARSADAPDARLPENRWDQPSQPAGRNPGILTSAHPA